MPATFEGAGWMPPNIECPRETFANSHVSQAVNEIISIVDKEIAEISTGTGRHDEAVGFRKHDLDPLRPL
jgi:hypothetical protein